MSASRFSSCLAAQMDRFINLRRLSGTQHRRNGEVPTWKFKQYCPSIIYGKLKCQAYKPARHEQNYGEKDCDQRNFLKMPYNRSWIGTDNQHEPSCDRYRYAKHIAASISTGTIKNCPRSTVSSFHLMILRVPTPASIRTFNPARSRLSIPDLLSYAIVNSGIC